MRSLHPPPPPTAMQNIITVFLACESLWYYTDIDQDGHELSRFYGLPRELYFPKGKYCPHRHMIFHPSRSISVILDGQNEWFPQILSALRLPRSLVTRLGVCVQNKTERKLDRLRAFYYDVLLLSTAYAVHFFLGQFRNMELMLLVLSPLFYLLNCYIFVIASLRLL